MTAPGSWPGRLALICIGLLGMTALARAQGSPLAVTHGKGFFVLQAERPGQAFALVVGAPTPGTSSVRLTLQTEATVEPVSFPREADAPPDPAWLELRKEQLRLLIQSQKSSNPAPEFGDPAPPIKTFHLPDRDYGLDNPAHYRAVIAHLHTRGRTCQVYLDRAEKRSDLLEQTIVEIVRYFDEELYPWTRKHLGRAADVDRDGRFTILLTPAVGQIQGADRNLQGFVRSTDFLREMSAPFSNGCDMLYLTTGLTPGPHLRTLLAHEFAHAIVFCEHALNRPGLHLPRDEENWLNEGLAHLVEALQKQSWTNLDYRISAYLSAPERYRLVVADYFTEKLWRDPGTRGATFLFLQWCHDRHGPDFLNRLVQSPHHGIDNLEIATQKRFVELFRQWSIEQLVAPWQPAGKMPFRPLLAGPRCRTIDLEKQEENLLLASTAVVYFRLEAPRPGRYRVVVTTDAPTELQVTLMPLNQKEAFPLRAGRGEKDLTLHLPSSLAGVKAVGIEWLHPGPGAHTGEFLLHLPGSQLKRQPTGEVTVDLPASLQECPLAIKVIGTDEQGRRLIGWTTLPGRQNFTASGPTPANIAGKYLDIPHSGFNIKP